MRQAWAKLLTRRGVAPIAISMLFDQLLSAYSSPERFYHNLEHLREMFVVAAPLEPIMEDPEAVQLAIWYHDAIYDPRARDNEFRSAELAVEMLGPVSVPASTLERVVQLVNATAHLSSADPPGDGDTAVLLDADLAILGTPEVRYQRYAADIRAEYSFVPEADYRVGRAAVLRRFLARSRLFLIPAVFEEREGRARANIASELQELEG